MKTLLHFLVCCFLLALPDILIGQVTYTVNTTDNNNDGVCDSNHCTLNEAITLSNNDGVLSNIHFNIPNSGPFNFNYFIYSITDNYTIIDGTTQPNHYLGLITFNYLELSSEYNEIYGLQFDGSSDGLRINNSNNIIGDENKGNIFSNCSRGIRTSGSISNLTISHNYIGTNPQGNNIGNSIYGIACSDCNNSVIEKNIIGYNANAIWLSTGSSSTELNENTLYCNNKALRLNTSIPAPIITSVSNSTITGTAPVNSTIEIYYADGVNCYNSVCQGTTYIGQIISDNSGNWIYSLSTPLDSSFSGTIACYAYDGDLNSNFSCFEYYSPPNLNGNYIVNTTLDNDDGNCDSNHCSLREAIIASNDDTLQSNISFNIPGIGPHVINLVTTLPSINYSGNTNLDATTQPNFSLGSIILKGSGISITSSNNTIKGLKILEGEEAIRIVGDNNNIISNIIGNGGAGINDASISNSGNKIIDNFIGIDDKNNPLPNTHFAILNNNSDYIVKNNTIAFNSIGFANRGYSYDKLSNHLFCNSEPTQLSQFITPKPSPIINAVSDSIYGISSPYDTIYIFSVEESCQEVPCQGKDILFTTVTDHNGNWSYLTPNNFERKQRITAVAVDSTFNTSEFASCFIILPDACTFSELLSVNLNPCNTQGIVLDLKQLTLSPNPTQSSCASTLISNDAWYQIEVPPTGNFQVRSNINNTVNPVIEAYTGSCGNLNLVDCSEIDSLPKTMVFENYTAGNTVYLRVWDKNNTITASANTALLHLTAHELSLNKDEWELCDQENNLINGNPTILSERDANSFILEYESNATPADIAAIEQELLSDGSTLSESCLCNGVPLQLWKSGSPIDVEDRRRRMKTRANVDTTNYNYVFETIEFQVNAYAIGEQYATDVAMDAEGNFAMVWIDQQRRHNYGRVYKSSGNPITQEFQLGASDKTQYNSSIAMDDSGDFVAVWHEINPAQAGATFAIYGRQYNADGTPKNPSFDISTPSANTSTDQDVKDIAPLGANAQVAVDGSGNFNVVWHVGSLIFAQQLDNSGSLVGNIIEVGTTIDNNISPNPSIGVNDSGEFIIVWNGQDADETGIYAQRYSANGTPVGSAIAVNSFDTGAQSHPDVVLANDGSFVVTWESFEQEGPGLDYGVYAQRFDSGGNKVSTEFLVNNYTTDAQRHPSISLFDDGSFVIAWSSRGQDGFEEGIYAKVFDANGTPITPPFNDSANGSVGEEFRMNSYEEPEQEKPSTATNGSNIMIGAWEDGANDGSFKGIFAQRYEILPDNTNTKIFYPIGTATPSTLLGDQLDFPVTVYTPSNAVKRAKVAIIDTGIDEDHSHLVNALWTNPATNDGDNCVIGDVYGYDFVNEAGTPIDLDGHGTKVSGIVTRDFDTGVQLELMSLKFHELNRGKVFDAICAIYYAVDNGAEILNLSWGFEAAEYPAILNKALKYASDQGVLIVTTAGNTSKNNDKINKFPANLNIENMIVVTSYEYRQSDGSKRLANYASYGQSQVDIAAYGYVESPKAGGGLEPSAGTSLAAPMVARTAATIKGLYPILTATEIKDCILSSAEQVSAFSTLVSSGGILDHDAALACAQNKHDMITAAACAASSLGASPTITDESCAGMDGSISLTTSGTDPNPSFCWSNAETTASISNLVPGTYSVTITDDNRCVREYTYTVATNCTAGACQTNLVINSVPIPDNTYQSDNTIISAGTIPSGGDVTFKAEQSITLQPGFQVDANADFLAIIEVCPPSSSQELPEQLKINQTDNIPNSLSAKVYPNPTFDQLTVEVFKDKQGFQLEVFDVMGRLLNRWNIRENQATLSVQQLNAGMYYLRIDGKLIEKVVVGNK